MALEERPNDESERSNALTVSAAMTLAQHALEAVTVRIIGEVSEVSVKPGYKAAYFTVKDAQAALPCMMWNNRYRASGVQLAVGQLVEITGRFTLYAAKGRMNFDVFSLAMAGEGDLRLKVANIAKKLAAEGLTAPERKRRIPEMPERIGLVTSPRSAAVHDVLRTLRRRFPMARVLLAGVPVEGAQAAAQVAQGVRCVADAGAQVVLIVRGGGSFEDLMPFNDEALARTIAACPVPTVTGIGHEVDTTIADMVSDLRASTPTAAAEAVSPAPEALEALFSSRASAMASAVQQTLFRSATRIDRIAERPMFTDPLLLFASDAQALDGATDRMMRALPLVLERAEANRDARASRLVSAGAHLTERFDSALATSAARLHDWSPLKTLARGYAIARDNNGAVVRSVDAVGVGENLHVRVYDGTYECRVVDAARDAQGEGAE